MALKVRSLRETRYGSSRRLAVSGGSSVVAHHFGNLEGLPIGITRLEPLEGLEGFCFRLRIKNPKKVPRSARPNLWIAGGIGVTPFVAWAQAMDPRDNPATLVYCVRYEDGAAHLRELEVVADKLPNFTLVLHASETSGRATADTILETTGLDASNLSIAFCGPDAMRKAMSKAFTASGMPGRKFRYEEFEIRSGIGLKALSAYLLDRMTRSRHAPAGSTG